MHSEQITDQKSNIHNGRYPSQRMVSSGPDAAPGLRPSPIRKVRPTRAGTALPEADRLEAWTPG